MYCRFLYNTACKRYSPRRVFYLDEVSGKQLCLPSRNAVVQDLPSFPQAKLHDIMLDRCCVIGRRDPGEQDSLLRAIGCEAPWWGKQHQWFRGTCRKYWKSTLGLRVCVSISVIHSVSTSTCRTPVNQPRCALGH